MRQVRAVGVIYGALALALGVGFRSAESSMLSSVFVGTEVGDHPPSFSAADLKGARHTLKDYRGQVLVLHFWASWCPHCQEEVPKLVQLHRSWGDKGVQVLTVSIDTNRTQLTRFIAFNDVAYPVVLDMDVPSSVVEAYEVWGVPTTFVVSRDGHIASRLDGNADLLGEVQRVLAQSPSPSHRR